jgi:hypothetical protein
MSFSSEFEETGSEEYDVPGLNCCCCTAHVVFCHSIPQKGKDPGSGFQPLPGMTPSLSERLRHSETHSLLIESFSTDRWCLFLSCNLRE